MTTEIKPCDCTAVQSFPAGSGLRTARPLVPVPFYAKETGALFQDSLYGKGMRVHNIGKKTATCTVCGKVKGA